MLGCLISTSVIDDGVNGVSTVSSFFYIKLLLSQLSSSFGMAKFLQLGPCQLIPQNKMGIGMVMIAIVNFLGLMWKVCGITALTIYTGLYPSVGSSHLFFAVFWRSSCILLLPSLILVTF